MRQSFMYEKADEKGQRTLDYSALINEKENQIVQLEKKISGMEGRHRIFDQRIR